MQFHHLLLAILLVMLGLVGVLLTGDAPANATGMAHPTIEGMSVGGDGLARLGEHGWAMSALFILVFVFMSLLPALGVPARLRTRPFWVAMASITVTAAAMCWWMLSSWHDVLETGEVTWWLGFPLPTSLLLYAVWCSGLLLSVVYVKGFREFIYPPESEERYERLRAAADVPREPAA